MQVHFKKMFLVYGQINNAAFFSEPPSCRNRLILLLLSAFLRQFSVRQRCKLRDCFEDPVKGSLVGETGLF